MKAFLVMAAVWVGVAGAGRTEAAIIHRQMDPALSASSYQAYGVPLNTLLLEGAAWSEMRFEVYSEYYYSSGDAWWDCYTRLLGGSPVKVAMTGAAVSNLPVDAMISGALTYSDGPVNLAGYWRYKGWGVGWDPAEYSGTFGGGGVVPGYLGLRLNDGTDTYYGWMRVDVTGSTTPQLTIYEWAVNLTPGEMIRVGQTVVPEPAAMSVLGGVVLLALRRRRR